MSSRAILCGLLATLAWAASAKPLSVETTLPELAWAAREIGGARVEARSLLAGSENPHYVDATPELVRRVAAADVVCVVGLDLEVGYMPAVMRRAGNAAVQPGGKGHCDTGRAVTVLDKPQGPVDRSMGDVHPGGNPHFHLSPVALGEAAGVIADTLRAVDPANAAAYAEGLTRFRAALAAIDQEIRAKLARAGDVVVIEYHKEFTYFLRHYGVRSLGSIEEKPGVPPSAGRLATVAKQAKDAGVRVALAATYSPSKTLARFGELAGVPVVQVPAMIQPTGATSTYAAHQHRLADAILDAK